VFVRGVCFGGLGCCSCSVCVCVSGVLFSVGVCVCDLLICLQRRIDSRCHCIRRREAGPFDPALSLGPRTRRRGVAPRNGRVSCAFAAGVVGGNAAHPPDSPGMRYMYIYIYIYVCVYVYIHK